MKTRVLRKQNSSFGQAESNQVFKFQHCQFSIKTASFGISQVFRVLLENSSFREKLEFWMLSHKTASFHEKPPVLIKLKVLSKLKFWESKTPVLPKLKFWESKTPVLGNPRASTFLQLENSQFWWKAQVLMFWTKIRFSYQKSKTRVLKFYIKTPILKQNRDFLSGRGKLEF